SEFAFRISGWRSISARFFWLVLLLSDKTLIVNALAGRMEFHALGFTLLSFVAAFMTRSAGQFLIAGLCIGLAIGFHPLAVCFYPALCMVAIIRIPLWSVRLRATFFAGIGAAIPCVIYAMWFLSKPEASAVQFLMVVHSSSSSILQSFIEL